MRGLSKPHNAEGSSHPTETEEQTTRGGVQGDKKESGMGEGKCDEEGGRRW